MFTSINHQTVSVSSRPAINAITVVATAINDRSWRHREVRQQNFDDDDEEDALPEIDSTRAFSSDGLLVVDSASCCCRRKLSTLKLLWNTNNCVLWSVVTETIRINDWNWAFYHSRGQMFVCLVTSYDCSYQ